MTQPEKPEAEPTAKAVGADSGTVRIAMEESQPAKGSAAGSASGSAPGSGSGTAAGTGSESGTGSAAGTTSGSTPATTTAAAAGTTPIARSGAQAGGVTSGMIKADGSEVTSSAPPPWQRVAEDNRYAEEHAAPPAEDKPRFEDWGYQRSPRSEAYPTSSEQPTVTAFRPPPEAGRTTVNLGAPPTQSPRVGSPASPSAQPSALRRPGRGPRRASLQVKRVDPWSVLKLAGVLAVALFLVWMVAVGVLYGVLDGMGVWDKLNGTYTEFAQNTSAGAGGPLITAGRVMFIAAIIGGINIVLITALATVGAFVYNVSADLAGGLEVTLAERE